jgi:hypothetical protein
VWRSPVRSCFDGPGRGQAEPHALVSIDKSSADPRRAMQKVIPPRCASPNQNVTNSVLILSAAAPPETVDNYNLIPTALAHQQRLPLTFIHRHASPVEAPLQKTPRICQRHALDSPFNASRSADRLRGANTPFQIVSGLGRAHTQTALQRVQRVWPVAQDDVEVHVVYALEVAADERSEQGGGSR